MRRFALPVAILVALASAASAAASPVFVFKGHGWGHGVGLSQYGALGRANDGKDYKQILGFYYDGTNVGTTSQRKIRVLLTAGRSSVTLRSSQDFKVGDKTLAGLMDWKVVPTSDGKVRVVGKGKFGDPATAKPGEGFLKINGLRYRGDLKIYNRGGKLAVVNVVGLQSYLYSVVPREMPSSWPLEALKAQAVAARGYAVRAARASWYDIYDDTNDQVYGGLDYGSGEDPGSTAAVKATAGEVLKYGGDVISAYFSSSNGGRTAASGDTWFDSRAVPHLEAGSLRPERVEPEPQLDRGALAACAAEPARCGEDSCGCHRHASESRVAWPRPAEPGWVVQHVPGSGGPRPGVVPRCARPSVQPLRLRRPRRDAGEDEDRLQRPPSGQRSGEGGIGRHPPAPAKRLIVLDRHVHDEGRRGPLPRDRQAVPRDFLPAPFLGCELLSGRREGRAEDRLLRHAARERRPQGLGAPPLACRSDRARRPQAQRRHLGEERRQRRRPVRRQMARSLQRRLGTYRARLAPPSSTGLVPGSTGAFNFN